jgi:hypothetical protein
LEVDTLRELAKMLGTIDGDGSQTKQKDHDDENDVRGGRGGERPHRQAGGVRELWRGEDRTWAV